LLEHHWPDEQRGRAARPTASVAAVAAPPVRAAAPEARVSASAGVVAALHDVLRGGLVVQAQADTRPRRRRRARGAPGAAQG
jgi:hypothetical protein